jgi:hypothetical protein
LKFAGALGFGILAAPFIGSASRFMPAYYKTNSPNQSQGSNGSDNNRLIRTPKGLAPPPLQTIGMVLDMYSLFQDSHYAILMKHGHLQKISEAMALCAAILGIGL